MAKTTSSEEGEAFGVDESNNTPETNASVNELAITPEMMEGGWIGSDFETQVNTCEIPDSRVDAIAFRFMKTGDNTANYIPCNNGDITSCNPEASAAPEISSSFDFEINDILDASEEGYDCLVTVSEKIEISMRTENSGSLKRYISAQRTEGTECDEFQQAYTRQLMGDADAYLSSLYNENGCNAEYVYTISRAEE